jgi:Co/Zn/Cd efflux system component
MEIVGSILAVRWSLGLIWDTSSDQLDHKAPQRIGKAIAAATESRDGNNVTEFHTWPIGSNNFAAMVSIVTEDPKPTEHYKVLLPANLGLVHTTIEVNRMVA